MPIGRIFYYCADHNLPHGGEKDSYQHVDILNRAGFDAYAVHATPGFRQTWFENDTRVACAQDIDRDPLNDYLVLPESEGLTIATFPGRKVIYNKNIYHGFTGMQGSDFGPTIYLSSDIVAVFCVSAHNQACLQYAYPGRPIFLVRLDIRPERFPLVPLERKTLEIAYATKAHLDGMALRQMMRGRAASGYAGISRAKWTAIRDLAESQVSEILQRSLVFLFLSAHEGLGRLPIEAMAAGCIVCAYDCGPMVEYLPAAYRFQHGDLVGIARRIETLIDAFPDGLADAGPTIQEGRRIALTHDAEAQQRTVLNAWERIFDRANGRLVSAAATRT